VKSNRQFVIPFKGLKLGKHDFVFDIDDKFFDGFEGSEIHKGTINVEVILDKKASMLEFDFSLNGSVLVSCDVCLDNVEIPIEYDTKLFARFGDVTEEQTDEIIVLSHAEHEINVAQYIYEFCHLSLPYRRVHPADKDGNSTCNKEMLKKLEEYIVHEDHEETDPRWDDLKNLLNHN
jgi:uncharacterized protein